MKGTTAACLLLACQVSLCAASPLFEEQLVFKSSDRDRDITGIKHGQSANGNQGEKEWNVLHHLSGISPFFDSHGPQSEPPQQCAISSVSILARHGSITMNDDEYPETVGPFLSKLKKYKKKNKQSKKKHEDEDGGNALAFLKHWKTPVTEDNMEQLTGPGAKDAKVLGQAMGKRYADLIPEKDDPAIKIYTASSERDVDSGSAFVSGMFPDRSIGTHHGQVNLVSVPNKNSDWAFSLTPHKICDRFDKKKGKEERDGFQQKVAAKTIERLRNNGELPGWKWHWTDIIAMQQMCGYETVIRGSSKFCDVFTQEEWLEFEYGQDLYYYYMLGRHQKWTAALGVPWIQIATKKLEKTRDIRSLVPPAGATPTPVPSEPLSGGLFDLFKNKKKNGKHGKGDKASPTSSLDLPRPTQGPNATLAQAFHIWFTHREEVPLVTHALDLFHGHDDATAAMPLDRVNPTRVWKTSEIIPFLGHVSLERMECGVDGGQDGPAYEDEEGDGDKQETQSYVRIIVNGSPQEHPACHSGPGGSCPFDDFVALVDKLPGVYGELKDVCQEKED